MKSFLGVIFAVGLYTIIFSSFSILTKLATLKRPEPSEHQTSANWKEIRELSEYPRKILLLSTWRSGSTFLGELLSQNRHTYFAYEPLQYLSERPDGYYSTQDSLTLLRNLFACNFVHNLTAAYVKNIKKHGEGLVYNYQLNSVCHFHKIRCSKLELHEQLCLDSKIRLIKTVRIRLADIEDLLNVSKVMVVVLHRDPRGVINSRTRKKWCVRQEKCRNVTTLCNDVNSDLSSALKYVERYPKQVTFVRYEDLVLNPYGAIDKIIRFLMLPSQNPDINHYLTQKLGETRLGQKVHTSRFWPRSRANPSKTKRLHPKKVAFRWSARLDTSTIKSIEEKCQVTMKNLGYATFQPNMTLPEVLSKSAKETWPYNT